MCHTGEEKPRGSNGSRGRPQGALELGWDRGKKPPKIEGERFCRVCGGMLSAYNLGKECFRHSTVAASV